MLAQASPVNISPATEKADSKFLSGTNVPVWLLVSMLDDGMTEEQILKLYPSLSAAEIKAATKYANSATVEAGAHI